MALETPAALVAGAGAGANFLESLEAAADGEEPSEPTNPTDPVDPTDPVYPVTPTDPNAPLDEKGGGGDDKIVGAGGDDRIRSGGGDDTVIGGRGDDTIIGGGGADSIKGGGGADSLKGGGGEDTLKGGGGSDVLKGGGKNDLLVGGGGFDLLNGGGGNDTLIGGGGDDLIFGKGGSDSIRGGGGDDILDGGKGNDTMRGDAGADVFHFAKKDGANTILDFKVGEDILNLKNVTFDEDGRADVSIRPRGSEDAILEFEFTTIFFAGVTADELRDLVITNAADPRNVAPIAFTRGDDVFIDLDESRLIKTGPGDDSVDALGGDDELLLDLGNDFGDGGEGNDTLVGGAGNDDLSGGAGNDELDGDDGVDTYNGGPGSDRFKLHTGDVGDIVLDYTPGVDSILIKDTRGLTEFDSLEDLFIFLLFEDDGDGGTNVSVDGTDTSVNLRGVAPDEINIDDFDYDDDPVELGDGDAVL